MLTAPNKRFSISISKSENTDHYLKCFQVPVHQSMEETGAYAVSGAVKNTVACLVYRLC